MGATLFDKIWDAHVIGQRADGRDLVYIDRHVLHELHALWQERRCGDEYMGTLVNAYLAGGGRAVGVKAGTSYVDVGTLGGYRSAITLLSEAAMGGGEIASGARVALASPSGRQMGDQPAILPNHRAED